MIGCIPFLIPVAIIFPNCGILFKDKGNYFSSLYSPHIMITMKKESQEKNTTWDFRLYIFFKLNYRARLNKKSDKKEAPNYLGRNYCALHIILLREKFVKWLNLELHIAIWREKFEILHRTVRYHLTFMQKWSLLMHGKWTSSCS